MCISQKPAFLDCSNRMLKHALQVSQHSSSWKRWEEDKGPDRLVIYHGIYFMPKEGRKKDKDKTKLFSKSFKSPLELLSKSFKSLLFLGFQLLGGMIPDSHRDHKVLGISQTSQAPHTKAPNPGPPAVTRSRRAEVSHRPTPQAH